MMNNSNPTPRNEQQQQNPNSNFPNSAKKLPNPQNFKIVKCKNFERGKNRLINI